MPHLSALPYTRGMEVREPTPLPADSPLPTETTATDESQLKAAMTQAGPLSQSTRLPEKGRDELSLPPPVAAAAKTKGSWVIFAETDPQEGDPGFEDDQPVMMERGKNNKGKGEMEDGQEMWYCRERKRKLIFNELPRLEAEFANDPEFGRPVPPWKFWHPGDGKWVKRGELKWMYRREKPDPRRVGETFKPARVEADEEDVEMPVEAEARSVERKVSPTISEGAVSLGSERSDAEEGEAFRVAEATPPPELDVVMEDVEAGEVTEQGDATMEGVETVSIRDPYTDGNGRKSTLSVRVMGSSLNFSTQDMVDWIGVEGMMGVRRMWRIVVRGYTVDFVLEVENRITATQIVRDASADGRFRNNARFLDRDEMLNATRGVDEQLSMLPPSRRAAPTFPERRHEYRERSLLIDSRSRSFSSSEYSRSPSPKRGIKRSRSRSPERERDQRLRRLSPPSPPKIPRRPSFPVVPKLPFAPSSRAPPSAPRAMLPFRLAERPSLPPPPPPVPYATRPRITTAGASSSTDAPPSETGVPSLLRQLTAAPLPTASSLLDRLQAPPAMEKKGLMKRVDVKLQERISVEVTVKSRHRPHRRTHKRINKLVDVEMEIAPPPQESFPWTDAEIDFFIDHEEGPPPPDEMYEPYGDFYDTEEE
ncbi:hypothetical protein B0H16DRAFT_1746387 [Mycena metata]|uniref:Uncharacterized protein n=1 Tax=Mycena metata TaxID=1033252 RepID=A0AAD7MAL8_9AGAR|nr:hypothetical protein B0H16DRAFT_1746387 [Mycena metata]